jgi:midasin
LNDNLKSSVLGLIKPNVRDENALSSNDKIQVLIAVLMRLNWSKNVKGIFLSEDVSIMDNLLDILCNCWMNIERSEKQKSLESESLYKYKEQKHVFQTDEELDDAILLEKFPDYRQEFDDIVNINGNEKDKDEISAQSSTSQVNMDENLAFKIRQIHKKLCSDIIDKDLVLNWKDTFQQAYGVSHTLQTSYFQDESSTNVSEREVDSKCGHIFSSFIAIQDLRKVDFNSLDGPYDFYKDANVAEMQLVSSILCDFDRSLRQKLHQWPEHFVLNQLAQLSERIASFSINSPLIKILNGKLA